MVEVGNLTGQMCGNNISRNVEVQAVAIHDIDHLRETLAYCCGIIDSCSDKNIMLVLRCDPYCWKIAIKTRYERGWNAVIPSNFLFTS